MQFYVYTDGAARGNPGSSASGYQIFDEKHKLLIEYASYNGVRTNNFAEYLAIIEALRRVAKEYGNKNEIIFYSDSNLVVNQINGRYKVREATLRVLHKQATTLAKVFDKCEFLNVPRENKYISRVDKSLNELLDRAKKVKIDNSSAKAKKVEQSKLFG